ncbi:unnamed protein product [Pelagomonas calceolata]|uniref:Uncharacterized protein n=3 Tax=Pelagomonas calceolata TaxID=35677 RepID=A0A8J2SCB6_9STRA|nr:unnamed protein product [Pelagomonas calceolata]
MATLQKKAKKGAAISKLLNKQYEGADTTSLDDYLRKKKKVTLPPGQTRTEIPAVETSKFVERLSQCPGKGEKKQSEQKKYLRRVASFHFNTFAWSSGPMSISDAVANLVAVGAVVDPWLKADGTPVPVEDFPGFRRIGSVAKQDAADDWNDKQHNTKVRKLERRERNPAPGKKEASNTQGATLKWGEDSLVVANAAKEGVEVPRRSEEGERRRLLYTGRGPRGDRRQPRRAEGVECDSCTRNVSDGAGKVYSPHNHTTHILLAGGQLVCKICDTSGRVITDDLVEAGVKEEEIPLVARTWLYARCALREDRFGDASFGEAKDIFDEAIAASYDATVDCKEVTDRQQRLAEPAWAEQDQSQRAASRRRRAMRGVVAGDDDDADESASSSDDASARGAVSASPPPPRRPSGPPPLTSPVSEGSAGSGGSRSRASAASRAGSARSGHSARSASGAGRGSSRRRRRIRTVLRSPRSPSESPAKRRRLANDAARDYVEENFGVFVDFQAALRELCAGEHSGSFLADDAGALDDLLDAFLEKARRS